LEEEERRHRIQEALAQENHPRSLTDHLYSTRKGRMGFLGRKRGLSTFHGGKKIPQTCCLALEKGRGKNGIGVNKIRKRNLDNQSV